MEKAKKAPETSPAADAPEESSLGSSGGELLAAAAGAGHDLQDQVVDLTHQVKRQATDQLTTQKERLVDTLDMVALLLRQSGEHAQLQDKAMLAGYLDKASTHVGAWSKTIGTQEPAELIEQTKQFANRQPLVFVGGALAAGFLGTRFFRSSAQQLQSSAHADGSPKAGSATKDAAPPVADQDASNDAKADSGASRASDAQPADSHPGDRFREDADDVFGTRAIIDAAVRDAQSSERR